MSGKIRSSESDRVWRIVANAMEGLQWCRRRDPFDTRPLYRIAKTLCILSSDSDEAVVDGIAAESKSLLEPPEWVFDTLSKHIPKDSVSSEVDHDDMGQTDGIKEWTPIPVFSGASALREMTRMFDRRRDQVVALWMPEVASCKIDQVGRVLLRC